MVMKYLRMTDEVTKRKEYFIIFLESMKSPSAMARADASHMLKLCISKSETDPAQTKGAEEVSPESLCD